ncbi:cell wall anchor protein [Micromonospora sp. CPCC 206171]|uniref:cell wall anchor protein n=1 Tax=Micromonospora sp. CPCC 206171 TaxID=3122405 RepID=UPI002FEEAE71
MIFRNRPLARLGAVALLASGAFTVLGTPAYADNPATDLSLDVAGTRVAAGTPGKIAFAKLSNTGENTPTEVVLAVDVSKLDPAKVDVIPLLEQCEEITVEGRRTWACALTKEEIPTPGATLELPALAFKDTDAVTGDYSAPVTFQIQSENDTDTTNNSRTTQVEFTAESGVDLLVLAPDVRTQVFWRADGEPDVKKSTLNPGDETTVFALILNQGDMIADGVDLKMSLPRGVTFSQDLKECEYTADRRTADCRSGLTRLKPGADLYGVFPVKVAADVDAPVSLTGGAVEVSSRGALPATERSLADTPSELASFLTTTAPAGLATDVDPSDNSDNFAVIVAAKTGGDGGGDGGGEGGGGGLPVTGPRAGLLGGVGAAVLAAGGAMFVLARRRRVVLVTPGDEKPTA